MPSPALAVTPSGQYTLPLVRCAQVLASCAEVRSMLGVATAALAFAAIDYPTRDVETYGEPLPGIILEGRKQRRGYHGDQRGEIEIALYDEIDASYAEGASQKLDFKNDAAAWLNRVGAIVGQMNTVARAAMDDFDGESFNILSWADLVYPTHMKGSLGDETAPQWFRFAVLLVEWST